MLIRHKTIHQRRAAFTLMEMLVVVAIIVALAGIGGYFLLGQLGQSQKDIAKTQAKTTLTNACKTWAIRHGGAFPDSLQQLLSKDELGNPPILENQDALKDPWGHVFQYDKNGTNNQGLYPDISTTAPDGTKVGNWSTQGAH